MGEDLDGCTRSVVGSYAYAHPPWETPDRELFLQLASIHCKLGNGRKLSPPGFPFKIRKLSQLPRCGAKNFVCKK